MDAICSNCNRLKFIRHKKLNFCRVCYDKYLRKTNSEYREKQLLNTKTWYGKNKETVHAKRKLKGYYCDSYEYKRNTGLKYNYGITSQDYDLMFERQNGKCAICNSPQNRKLHVDHCHVTDKIRGLLCFRCNRGIGFLSENIDILNNAVKYLVSYK